MKLQTNSESTIELSSQQQRFAKLTHKRDGQAVPLPNGDTGWCVRRSDDCLAAAVASLLQVPIDQVPDPNLDASIAAGANADELATQMWSDLSRWAQDRGLQMTYHEQVPVDADRWIGIIPMFGFGLAAFADHCVVCMRDGTILFDPTCNVTVRPGLRLKTYQRLDIKAGISFQPATARS